MLSQVRSSPFGEEWFSHSRLYQPSDWGKKVILRMKVRRYKCKCADCDYDCQERISFAPCSHSYTRRFARYVVDLLKGMTLKDTAHLLGVSWDTIKEIHTHHLECHHARPSLEGVTASA